MTWTISVCLGLLLWVGVLTVGGWSQRDRNREWERAQRRHYRGRHRDVLSRRHSA
jgi:hypothetical protein